MWQYNNNNTTERQILAMPETASAITRVLIKNGCFVKNNKRISSIKFVNREH